MGRLVINLILSAAAVYMMTCFMITVVRESGGRSWKCGKPKLRKNEETRRVLVTIGDKDVVIALYDGKSGKFNVPGVTAWRNLPEARRGFLDRYVPWRKHEKNRSPEKEV